MTLFNGFAHKRVKRYLQENGVSSQSCPQYKQCKKWLVWVTLLIGAIVSALSYYLIMRIATRNCRPSLL